MSSVAQNRAGIASGVNNAVARTAGLIAIAVLGIVMLRIFSDQFDQRLHEANLPLPVAQSLQAQRTKLAAVVIPDDVDPATRDLIRRVIDESFTHGFKFVMTIGAALAITGAISAFFMIGRPALNE
jgi:hypothetical protein